MNLLIISTRFYPSKGGVQEVVKDIALHFNENKLNKVKVITSLDLEKLQNEKNPKGNKLKNLLLKFYPVQKEKYLGLSLCRLWLDFPKGMLGILGYPYRFIVSIYSLLSVVGKFKPDIVNYHFPDDSSIFVFFLLLINDRFKLAVNIHGNDLQIFYNKSPNGFFMDYIFSKADSIIVNSEYMKHEFLKKLPKYKDKICVIPNGIDVDQIGKEKKSSYFDERYAFYIGRIVEKKGVDILLKAFAEAQVPNLKLLIEGVGEEYENMKRLSKNLDLEDKVVFTHGTLNREDSFRYMKGALFGVMPSRIEPFGIVALEMMAAGIPIIASKTGGLEYILKDGFTALMFENGNLAELEEKIIEISRNQILRENLVKNAKNEVQKYDHKNIHILYEKEFERCLNG